MVPLPNTSLCQDQVPIMYIGTTSFEIFGHRYDYYFLINCMVLRRLPLTPPRTTPSDGQALSGVRPLESDN